MPEKELETIADRANMIVAGYAYTKIDDVIKVLNLNDPNEACILSKDGEMLSTNMDDATLLLAQAYYLKNRSFMEEEDA